MSFREFVLSNLGFVLIPLVVAFLTVVGILAFIWINNSCVQRFFSEFNPRRGIVKGYSFSSERKNTLYFISLICAKDGVTSVMKYEIPQTDYKKLASGLTAEVQSDWKPAGYEILEVC